MGDATMVDGTSEDADEEAEHELKWSDIPAAYRNVFESSIRDPLFDFLGWRRVVRLMEVASRAIGAGVLPSNGDLGEFFSTPADVNMWFADGRASAPLFAAMGIRGGKAIRADDFQWILDCYPSASVLVNADFDWMADMLDELFEEAGRINLGFHEGGWDFTIRTGYHPVARFLESRNLRLLVMAIDHMADDGDWNAAFARREPRAFGRAAARSWKDIAAAGIGFGFPTMRDFIRWRGIVSRRRSPSIPRCASTVAGMDWMFPPGRADPGGEAVCSRVLSALESDGRRDFTHVDSWLRSHDGMAMPTAPGFMVYDAKGLIMSCDDDAGVLAALDLADVMLLIAGCDPECPDADSLGGYRNSHANLLPYDVIGEMIGLLARDLPVDMVAEAPEVNVRLNRLNDV